MPLASVCLCPPPTCAALSLSCSCRTACSFPRRRHGSAPVPPLRSLACLHVPLCSLPASCYHGAGGLSCRLQDKANLRPVSLQAAGRLCSLAPVGGSSKIN